MRPESGVVTVTACALLAAACLGLSQASEGARPTRAPSTAQHAFAGGVLTLSEPLPGTVRLPALELELGSTLPEVLDAAAECAREPLGEHCNESTFDNEMPTRRVRVEAFYLDRTEVTVGAYERCVRAGACRRGGYAARPRFNRADLPVSFVSFDDALAYCRYRGMRLPSEAEYERAARGALRRRYPWGDWFNARVANHGRLGLERTDETDGFVELAPVASFPAGRTPEGVYDLAGNVAEWTSEPDAQQKLSGQRALRGGHYQSPAAWLRAASREVADRELRAPYVGFRCARSARPGKSATE